MFRFIKKEDEILHYWNAWHLDEKTSLIEFGIAGESKSVKKIKSTFFSSHKEKLNQKIQQKIKEGYQILDQQKLHSLCLNLNIVGLSLTEMVQKRTQVQKIIQDTLDQYSLGYQNFNDPNNSDNVLCFFVIDIQKAKEKINNLGISGLRIVV